MDVRTKRIYEDPAPSDGTRVLVDRLWPRGVSKADAALDDWAREVAPSDDLRRWFDHDPAKWERFRERYRAELRDGGARLDDLRALGADGTLTLLYAATNEEHNNAVALKAILEADDADDADGA